MVSSVDLVSAFESIGDNCEFGLVQRRLGYDAGSLLKWSRLYANEQLNLLLETPRHRLFLFENIAPTEDDMLEDQATGIQFHTSLLSSMVENRRAFRLAGEALHRLYREEYAKRLYLYDKLIDHLRAADLTFVYKMNGVDCLIIAERLCELLRSFNRDNRLLYVIQAKNGELSTVERMSKNLFVGRIEKFAPYCPVTDCKEECWLPLLSSAYRQIHDGEASRTALEPLVSRLAGDKDTSRTNARQPGYQ